MQFNEINDENITAETNCSHQIKAGGRNNNTAKAKRERERERVLVSKHSNRSISYALSISCMASDTLGREGMAPFLVVVIAPQALENLSSSLSFFSSCNTTHESASFHHCSNGRQACVEENEAWHA